MKKKLLPVITVLCLIVVIIFVILLGKVIKRYSPTDEQQDLSIHYNLTSEEEVAIIYNNELLDSKAIVHNGIVYLEISMLKDFINDRFYWDNNENILRYTTAQTLISVPAESTSYTVARESASWNHTIVKIDAQTAYIAIDFIKAYSDFAYEIFQDPNRVIITTAWGDYNTAVAKKNSNLRVLGGIKSPVLTDIKKGEELTILEEMETWTKVVTSDGIIGYIKAKHLSNPSVKTISSDYVPEEFTHIKKNFEINMIWHQVLTPATNNNISSVLHSTKGVNVVSPTWFYLKDNKGGIGSLASLDYVNYCHQQGVEVWALVSNFGAKDQGLENPDLLSILTHSSSRDALVNNLISHAIQYNLDGINIDFESVDPAVGDSYIQFIRELSLKCANNGIVLSVDNYVPTAYTAFYNRAEQALFADYIAIMAYDEHYAGSEPGSVASIGWVKEGIENTLKEVPAEQIILGMPFYARVWSLTPSSDDSTDYNISCYSASMGEQKNLINVHGVTPVWSDETGQYYVEYTKNNSIYKIWMEDATSIEQKLKLMDSFQLAGGAFWKVGLEQSSVWNTIIKYIN